MPPDSTSCPATGIGTERRPRGATWMLVLGALAALGLLMLALGYFFLRGQQEDSHDLMVYTVQRGPFVHEVSEKGEIESSNSVEVRCQVKARKSTGTELLEVVPEGTVVTSGQILARLDSSGLEVDLVQQQIVCSKAEAEVIKARNVLDAAQIAKTEYEKGKYEQEKQDLEKAIFMAEEDLRRAEQYSLYSERLAAKGYVTELQLVGDRFAVEKARKELQSAKLKLEILERYTRQKELMQLEADVKTAEANWTAQQRSYELELKNLQEIKDQIEVCIIRSPADGTVVHANQKSWRGSSSEFIVEPGVLVRENQALLRLPDPSQMQVEVPISETEIALVEEGMPAAIRLGTNDDEVMHGEVTQVNEYAEPSYSSSTPKEYLAFVKILDPLPTLRTGLTAKVRIVVNRVDDALQVPVQAVLLHEGNFFCVVRDDQGGWYATRVTIGATNDATVVIRSGLAEGMRVSMNPEHYLDRVDLPEAVAEEAVARPRRRVSGEPSSPSDSGGAP